MAMATLTSNNTLGDASFSSYLNGAEKTFVLHHIPLGRNKPEYGELDVFSAERYFNEQLEEQELTTKIMNKKDDPDGAESLKRNTRPATPSVRSESSYNSRSLLMNVWTPQQKPKGNSSWRKSLFERLGCNCSCIDDNSVDISENDNQGEARKGANNGRRARFGRTDSNNWLKEEKEELEKRKEVKMLAWDAIPQRVLEIETQKCPNGEYNDTKSESSSDLFEIDSFTTNYTNPYLVREASDVMSGCITPTTCYAPSEASVQWSTVTASMADFSVTSDSEELETVPPRASRSRKVRDERNTQTTTKSHGILSSCKSHKTVRVGGEAHRTTDKAYSDLQRQQKTQTTKQTRRLQTENKQTRLNTMNSHRLKIEHTFTVLDS